MIQIAFLIEIYHELDSWSIHWDGINFTECLEILSPLLLNWTIAFLSNYFFQNIEFVLEIIRLRIYLYSKTKTGCRLEEFFRIESEHGINAGYYFQYYNQNNKQQKHRKFKVFLPNV